MIPSLQSVSAEVTSEAMVSTSVRSYWKLKEPDLTYEITSSAAPTIPSTSVKHCGSPSTGVSLGTGQSASAAFVAASKSSKSLRASPNLRATVSDMSLRVACSSLARSSSHSLSPLGMRIGFLH